MALAPGRWMAGLQRALGRERSFATTLALTIGGLLLLAIIALSAGGVGLLRKQAQEQALARVQLAGVNARDELRRRSEEALTSARLLASRPTLLRLAHDGNPEQLDFFFHPQVYRADGESLRLPDGIYDITFRRGPESLAESATAQSDGDVERISEIVTVPLPRNGSPPRRSLSRSTSATIGAIW